MKLYCPECGQEMKMGVPGWFECQNNSGNCNTAHRHRFPIEQLLAMEERTQSRMKEAAFHASQLQADLDYHAVKDSKTIGGALEKIIIGEHPVDRMVKKAEEEAIRKEREENIEILQNFFYETNGDINLLDSLRQAIEKRIF